MKIGFPVKLILSKSENLFSWKTNFYTAAFRIGVENSFSFRLKNNIIAKILAHVSACT